MLSYCIWKHADKPNYCTNVDLVYPYSEIPHQGDQTYLKIPVSPTGMVKHVDYWGEGRVVSEEGIRGFPKSYNVNHQFRLVSSGPDTDKKIPNRIPLVSYKDCDTSAFIRDNSVLIVTVPGANINSNCARDIARMVNAERGKVVVYSKHGVSENISELTAELNIKGLVTSKNAELDSKLLGLTYFDSHVVFITSGKNEKDINALQEDLYNYVANGNYEAAVHLSKIICDGVSEVVTKLIRSIPRRVMPYAYKLWYADGQYLVRKLFPKPFQLIFDKHTVRIINKQYSDTVRLINYDESKEDFFVGGNPIEPENFKRWRTPFMVVSPIYDRGELAFLFKSIDQSMYIKIVEKSDKDKGDLLCRASRIQGDQILTDDSYRFLLNPLIEDDGQVVFLIISARNEYHLKMDEQITVFGDNDIKRARLVRGHIGTIDKVIDIFKWIIEEVSLDPVLQSGTDEDLPYY